MSHPRPNAALPRSDLELLADTQWLGELTARLVGDPHLIEDARQEAWLAGIRRGATRGQLLNEVRRYLHRSWRAARRRGHRERQAARPEALPSTEEILAREEQRQRVWSHLHDLQEPLRTTLLLHFHEGLSTATLAEQLGVAPSTVTWRIRRGITLLRERLSTEDERGGLEALVIALPHALPGSKRGAVASGFTGGALSPLLPLMLMKKLTIGLVALGLLALLFPLLRGATAPPAGATEPLVAEAALAEIDAPPPPASPMNEDPVPRKAGARAPASLDVLTTLGPPPEPPVVRLHLSVKGNGPLPARVSVRPVFLLGERSLALPGDAQELDVEDAPLDIVLTGGPVPLYAEGMQGHLEVTADGFGTQRTAELLLPHASGSVTDVELLLVTARSVAVLAVDEQTGAPLREVVYGIEGPSSELGGSYRSPDGEPIRLELSSTNLEESFVHVLGAGSALRSWSGQAILDLPGDSDGLRRLPLPAGCAWSGTVELASGLPLPEDVELRYSTRRTDETRAGSWPVWMAPRGEIALDTFGRFETAPLPPGQYVLHLQSRRASHNAAPLSPEFVVELPATHEHVSRLVVPDEARVLTLNLTWGEPGDEQPGEGRRALFVELHRVLGAGGEAYGAEPELRALLARRDWVESGVDTELRLPAAGLEKGEALVLRVGPLPDQMLERTLVLEGPSPRLDHAFGSQARTELTPLEPEQDPRERERRAAAHEAGRQERLHARTSAR